MQGIKDSEVFFSDHETYILWDILTDVEYIRRLRKDVPFIGEYDEEYVKVIYKVLDCIQKSQMITIAEALPF